MWFSEILFHFIIVSSEGRNLENRNLGNPDIVNDFIRQINSGQIGFVDSLKYANHLDVQEYYHNPSKKSLRNLFINNSALLQLLEGIGGIGMFDFISLEDLENINNIIIAEFIETRKQSSTPLSTNLIHQIL